MSLIELREATAGYNGHRILHDVSLSIRPGERVALVGRSGAGKSTLLRLFYERVNGDAALVPQDFGLVKALSVFHNVYIGRLNKHSVWRNLANLVKPLQSEVEGIRPVAARLGLEEKLFESVGTLSGGQQQRTAVGRALYQTESILLGDEPVSSVDEHQARTILESIAESKKTVILAMHDTALALEYSDRVVALRDGRVVFDESCDGMTPADLKPIYGG